MAYILHDLLSVTYAGRSSRVFFPSRFSFFRRTQREETQLLARFLKVEVYVVATIFRS